VSIIAVADIQKQEYIAEEEYTLLEGFDSGKMAGLGLPGFFVTSNTCKGHRKELYFETEGVPARFPLCCNNSKIC
jgi:hypothetical protein